MSTTTTATPTPNHHQPVPHPILIPLIPSLALLAAFILVIYLNREAFSCLRARSDGYVHADRDEGGRVYESRKMGKKKKQQGRTRGDKMARLGLRSRMKSRSDEDDGIEMRPLMRNGMENGTTSSSSMIYEGGGGGGSEHEQESESESESFFIPSDSSSLASSSNSGDDIDTDPLSSLSKYFDPRTHVLLSKYRDPPSPVTDTWEIELRQRIREGGSVTAWVDYVVDCVAEWWEGMSM
ncbi:hypothetical protein DTO217A2_7926 [Paecilomyces variotii]|nr:hypothetical protein DTO217A2_7926 [Paecilomyces variotii]KAJ9371846.1 hypothetical protein DTO282E5_3467 [Paecilomyces variotii]KAJ9399841.1 hypothetical protein DTO282F9_3189 [Paecilomyces variotii]